MNITTSELSDTVAASINGLGLTKAQVKATIDATLLAIGNSLKAGDEVRLHNFGAFSTSQRPERQGRNPATGESMMLSASTSVKFKASKALKDKVA